MKNTKRMEQRVNIKVRNRTIVTWQCVTENQFVPFNNQCAHLSHIEFASRNYQISGKSENSMKITFAFDVRVFFYFLFSS